NTLQSSLTCCRICKKMLVSFVAALAAVALAVPVHVENPRLQSMYYLYEASASPLVVQFNEAVSFQVGSTRTFPIQYLTELHVILLVSLIGYPTRKHSFDRMISICVVNTISSFSVSALQLCCWMCCQQHCGVELDLLHW